ncbi:MULTISPECIES: hypothetical protein [unclassified Pseudomonas]|uniref:hypothetical protein n=1 Tax=unclassified Pseudomonas TaxID=196821 RepID=UPI001912FD43|nr:MULTISPECIES: hypothetical protein [unclassified Pseudomonas]MBK5374140.1 hypothetical protein [Pseudomonas sp. TH43]MBK5512899.1 hypothetical protein [Pseudomonas sp. TH15]
MSETTLHCDGRIAITVEPREMRMSHWLYAPLVVDQQRQQVLLDLSESLWDLIGTADETANSLELLLRKYPGDRPSVMLSVDLDSGELKLGEQRIEPSQLLSALDSTLN